MKLILIASGIAILIGIAGYFWQSRKEESKALADSLATVRRANKTASKAVEAVSEENARVQSVRSSWEPTARLIAKGMSANAQRLDILENLIRAGQLKPTDTIDRTPAVRYNLQENESIAVTLQVCDSIRVADKAQRAQLAIAATVKDSLNKERDWGDNVTETAKLRGIFTGKNKKLRQQIRARPFR